MNPSQPAAAPSPPATSNVPFVAMILSPFLIVGSIALAYGGWQAFAEWRFLRDGAHTRGTVVRLERGTSHRVYPIVRFRAADAESVEFRSVITLPYTVDQEVGVVYDPSDIHKAEIDSPDAFYAAAMLPVFGVIVLSFCFAVLAVVWAVQRSSRKKAALAG